MPHEIVVRVELSERSINLLGDVVSEWMARLVRMIQAGTVTEDLPRPVHVATPADDGEQEVEEMPAPDEPEADAPPAVIEGGGISFTGGPKLTPDRVILMARLRRDAVPWNTVLARVNDLPGTAIASVGSLQFAFFKLRRDGVIEQVDKMDAAAPRKVNYEVSAKLLAEDEIPLHGARTDLDAVLHWAHHNGVEVAELDADKALSKINQARENLRLPKFVLIKPRGQADRLPAPNVGAEDFKGKSKYRKPRVGDSP